MFGVWRPPFLQLRGVLITKLSNLGVIIWSFQRIKILLNVVSLNSGSGLSQYINVHSYFNKEAILLVVWSNGLVNHIIIAIKG